MRTRQNPSTGRKTCLNATSFTTNPTWKDVGLKLRLGYSDCRPESWHTLYVCASSRVWLQMCAVLNITVESAWMFLPIWFDEAVWKRTKYFIAAIIVIIIISVMELGHLLTRSGLTYPEVSSKFYHDSFCQLGSSVSLPWVIYFDRWIYPALGP